MFITDFYFVHISCLCYLSDFVWLSSVLGTKRERGLLAWDKVHLEDSSTTLETEEIYDLPLGITYCLSSQSWVRYVPFCPWKGNRTQYSSEDNKPQSKWNDDLPDGTGVTEDIHL